GGGLLANDRRTGRGVRFAAHDPLARRRRGGPGSIPGVRDWRARTAGTREKSAHAPWLIRHASARCTGGPGSPAAAPGS
ncbi:hypothetical protein, partial [Altererythrobacter sp. C41]|uniref:hypothetical protein n=1 Tax=Altererythrobacter sp. C41 TaxID=2806021 RepID=UPI001EE45FB8